MPHPEARHDSRVGILRGIVVVASVLALAACGGAEQDKTEFTADPLTQTVPASTIPADTPVEPGVFRLVGRPTLTYDLVRSGAGDFGAEGLSMRIADAASDAAAGGALRAGTADGAILPTDAALVLAGRGQRLRIVLLLTSLTSGEVIVARGELADSRIAFAPGSDGELLLRSTLAAGDVLASRVELVPSADPGAVVLAGRADAAAVDAARAAELVAADPELQVLTTAGDQPGLLSRVLVVREDVARSKPGQLLAFIRGWQDLYLRERDDPEAAAAAIAARTEVAVERVTAGLAGLSLYDVPANAVELLPGGEFYDRTLRAISAASTASGRLDGPVDEGALIDGAFAQSVATAG